MFLFGLVSICQGLVHNFSGLAACRFFLGVLGISITTRSNADTVLGLVESGVFPACFYLIAMYVRTFYLSRLDVHILISQVVQAGRSTKALLVLLLIDHSRRRLRWTARQRHRQNGRYARLSRLAVDLHPGYAFIGVRGGAHTLTGHRAEGVVTCLVAATLFFFISDFPEEVAWLTPEEKEFIKARLHADVGESRRHDPLTLKSVLSVFKDCT